LYEGARTHTYIIKYKIKYISTYISTSFEKIKDIKIEYNFVTLMIHIFTN